MCAMGAGMLQPVEVHAETFTRRMRMLLTAMTGDLMGRICADSQEEDRRVALHNSQTNTYSLQERFDTVTGSTVIAQCICMYARIRCMHTAEVIELPNHHHGALPRLRMACCRWPASMTLALNLSWPPKQNRFVHKTCRFPASTLSAQAPSEPTGRLPL